MSRYTFVVMTDPVVGREDEYNDWYTNTHLGDVVKVDGFVAAQRFRLAQTDPEQKAPHRYLALYEIETDDLAATQKALSAATGSGGMVISEALDTAGIDAWYYEVMTDRVSR